MKTLLILLGFVIISGCATKYEKKDLIGTWEAVSETYLETGEFLKFEDGAEYIVEIKIDSLYVYDEVYAWRIKGDSILVNVFGYPWAFYIEELTRNKLIVASEEWFGEGKILTAFEKR